MAVFITVVAIVLDSSRENEGSYWAPVVALCVKDIIRASRNNTMDLISASGLGEILEILFPQSDWSGN